RFVGVNCGIMDQYACANGKPDSGILLDCAKVESEIVPLNMDGYAIVIGNTNKKRSLADSKYNERRSECDAGLAALQTRKPELTALCELDEEGFNAIADAITDPIVYKRVRHAVCENDRVKRSAELLAKGDIVAFGKQLNASHASLKDDYEVTGKELDAMSEYAQTVAGCIGSRMTGAGFGGCTVSIVEKDRVDAFIADVSVAYEKATGLKPDFYVSEAGDGVRELTIG
ncbi:MAG: galactokinase, partial [Clostridia bacterium]|nr:galactokinase [Clostridia bacterium]